MRRVGQSSTLRFAVSRQKPCPPTAREQIPEIREMVDRPPEWLQDWSEQVGALLDAGRHPTKVLAG